MNRNFCKYQSLPSAPKRPDVNSHRCNLWKQLENLDRPCMGQTERDALFRGLTPAAFHLKSLRDLKQREYRTPFDFGLWTLDSEFIPRGVV